MPYQLRFATRGSILLLQFVVELAEVEVARLPRGRVRALIGLLQEAFLLPLLHSGVRVEVVLSLLGLQEHLLLWDLTFEGGSGCLALLDAESHGWLARLADLELIVSPDFFSLCARWKRHVIVHQHHVKPLFPHGLLSRRGFSLQIRQLIKVGDHVLLLEQHALLPLLLLLLSAGELVAHLVLQQGYLLEDSLPLLISLLLHRVHLAGQLIHYFCLFLTDIFETDDLFKLLGVNLDDTLSSLLLLPLLVQFLLLLALYLLR